MSNNITHDTLTCQSTRNQLLVRVWIRGEFPSRIWLSLNYALVACQVYEMVMSLAAITLNLLLQVTRVQSTVEFTNDA